MAASVLTVLFLLHHNLYNSLHRTQTYNNYMIISVTYTYVSIICLCVCVL